MYTTISPKVRVLINLIYLFAHDHSTKVRGLSYSLIYNCPSCANISFAIFMADTAFIIFLFQVVLLLRFVWANSWQYYRYIFRTLYSWWHCSYISYTMSMAIWSLFHCACLNEEICWQIAAKSESHNGGAYKFTRVRQSYSVYLLILLNSVWTR